MEGNVQKNDNSKRMLLGVLMLVSFCLVACNKQVPHQQNKISEPTDQAPVVINVEPEQQTVSIEPTLEPTIEMTMPAPTVKPTIQPKSELTLSNPLLIVKKKDRILALWDGEQLIDSFNIDVGKVPEGDKKVQGDCKTPEGKYYIGYQNPNSHYYLSLGISYPNKEDAQEALNNGQIDQSTYNSIANAIDSGSQPPANTILGGGITVHGRVDDQRWTRGCIAVDNDVMDLLWESCPVGTEIIIYP